MLLTQQHNSKVLIPLIDHSVLEQSPGHGNAKLTVFSVKDTCWQEHLLFF